MMSLTRLNTWASKLDMNLLKVNLCSHLYSYEANMIENCYEAVLIKKSVIHVIHEDGETCLGKGLLSH